MREEWMHSLLVIAVLCLAAFVLLRRSPRRTHAIRYMDTPYVTRTTRSGHKVIVHSSSTAHTDGVESSRA